VLVESGNVLSSTSNFWRYSNTSIRSTNMEVKRKKERKRCCSPYSPQSIHPSSVARVSPCHHHIQNGIKKRFGFGVLNQGILPHHTTRLSIFISQLNVARWFERQVIDLGIIGFDHSVPNNPIMQWICFIPPLYFCLFNLLSLIGVFYNWRFFSACWMRFSEGPLKVGTKQEGT